MEPVLLAPSARPNPFGQKFYPGRSLPTICGADDAHPGAFDRFQRGTLQSAREPQLAEGPNEPLRRIELVPAKPVAVVRGKAMMKIVIALAQSDQSGEQAVARRDRRRIGLAPDHVGDRIDREGRMPLQHDAEEPAEENRTGRVVPEPSHRCWND